MVSLGHTVRKPYDRMAVRLSGRLVKQPYGRKAIHKRWAIHRNSRWNFCSDRFGTVIGQLSECFRSISGPLRTIFGSFRIVFGVLWFLSGACHGDVRCRHRDHHFCHCRLPKEMVIGAWSILIQVLQHQRGQRRRVNLEQDTWISHTSSN